MKILKSLFVLLSAFLFFYLLGSFYSADFDIKSWTPFTRYCISFLGGISSLIFSFLYCFKDKL